MRSLLLLASILFMESCDRAKISPAVSSCYPYPDIRRAQRIVDAPVIVQLSGGLITGGQLIASNGVAWGSCNLPKELLRDSLPIYVSGYFLTSPKLELKNLTPLPFEVTTARMR